ncbi:MAG: hypothetical protein Q8O83_00570 [bacterium]|nr:hypothetical protein [bacterium]
MNKILLRKIWSFGAYWASLMLIFILVFSGIKIVIHFMSPGYQFSRFWTLDIIGIAMIFTLSISVWTAKRIANAKEALNKIWDFGLSWASIMLIVSVIFFGTHIVQSWFDPKYLFSEYWAMDIIGATMLAAIILSMWFSGLAKFLFRPAQHTKKQ